GVPVLRLTVLGLTVLGLALPGLAVLGLAVLGLAVLRLTAVLRWFGRRGLVRSTRRIRVIRVRMIVRHEMAPSFNGSTNNPTGIRWTPNIRRTRYPRRSRGTSILSARTRLTAAIRSHRRSVELRARVC